MNLLAELITHMCLLRIIRVTPQIVEYEDFLNLKSKKNFELARH